MLLAPCIDATSVQGCFFCLFASFPYLLQKENSLFISAESTFMTNFAAAKKEIG